MQILERESRKKGDSRLLFANFSQIKYFFFKLRFKLLLLLKSVFGKYRNIFLLTCNLTLFSCTDQVPAYKRASRTIFTAHAQAQLVLP